MNTRTAYDSWSETYDRDRNLTRDLDHEVTRATLASFRFSSVLEIGCGTGKNTALLASIAAKVHALDFSDGMLAQAKTKVSADNVTFTVADLTRPWPCAARSADLIVCNLVLEHIGDLSFVFAEAARVLVVDGKFFVCELHPFRQYQGSQARFQHDQTTAKIPAFVHHLSDFTNAAEANGLVLERFQEWWHEEDQDKPPRLASFMFRKSILSAKVMHTEASDTWNPMVPELSVSDFDASLGFYCALGFHVRYRRADPAFAYLELGLAQIMLEECHENAWITADLHRPFGRGVNFQIEVSDAQATAAQATGQGILLFRPVVESWYAVGSNQEEGQIEFLVQDPDGYLLRFTQPLGGRTTDAQQVKPANA